MKCPNCQSPLLEINVSFTGNVACRFSEGQKFQLLEKVALKSEFAENAGCRCLVCNWEGRVADARTAADSTSRRSSGPAREPLTPREFEHIRQESDSLSPRSRAIVRRLISEVERLNSLLDTVTRLSGGRQSDDDTVVG